MPMTASDPFCVQVKKRWIPSEMVTPPKLDEEVPASVEHFERVLPFYAEVQIAAAAEVERMLEVGVPDVRLPAFLRQVEALPPALPSRMPTLLILQPWAQRAGKLAREWRGLL